MTYFAEGFVLNTGITNVPGFANFEVNFRNLLPTDSPRFYVMFQLTPFHTSCHLFGTCSIHRFTLMVDVCNPKVMRFTTLQNGAADSMSVNEIALADAEKLLARLYKKTRIILCFGFQAFFVLRGAI